MSAGEDVSTRIRLRRGLVAVGATVVVTVGAAPWAFTPQHDGVEYVAGLVADGPPFATYDEGRTAMLALYANTKLVLRDGCLILTPADGQRRGSVVLLPRDTEWDPWRQQLTLDGRSARVGEVGNYGGGGAGQAAANQIPAPCRDAVTPEGGFAQLGHLVH